MRLMIGVDKKASQQERLQRILELHLDPKVGSRYWLEKEQKLGFSIRRQIRTVDDLWRLGPMNLEDLSHRCVEDFIPRQFLIEKRRRILVETGGATGTPKRTAYFEEEFFKIFVDSFISTALNLGFTGKGSWLWIGPGGPHVIGKACNAIAKNLSDSDAFSIDFDPRWYRKLGPGSFGRERYMEHLIAQVLAIWNTQKIENIFATPAVLQAIADRLNTYQRKNIRGIYLGGMPLAAEAWEKMKTSFPNAIIIIGYGNTLFGVCHCLKDLNRGAVPLAYYPHHDRAILRLVSMEEGFSDSERLRRDVDYGQRGQVVFHRLDESCFLPNVMERDTGIRLQPTEDEKLLGCLWDGIGDPRAYALPKFQVEEGIY